MRGNPLGLIVSALIAVSSSAYAKDTYSYRLYNIEGFNSLQIAHFDCYQSSVMNVRHEIKLDVYFRKGIKCDVEIKDIDSNGILSLGDEIIEKYHTGDVSHYVLP